MELSFTTDMSPILLSFNKHKLYPAIQLNHIQPQWSKTSYQMIHTHTHKTKHKNKNMLDLSEPRISVNCTIVGIINQGFHVCLALSTSLNSFEHFNPRKKLNLKQT